MSVQTADTTDLGKASVKPEGTEWPFSAIYRVTYYLRSAPCGFGDRLKVYFDTEEDMNKWLNEQQRWAREEGNAIEFIIYEWYYGPKLVRTDYF